MLISSAVRLFHQLLLLVAGITVASVPTVVAAAGCVSGTLADEFVADRLGFDREWIIQLPSMAPGCRLQSVSVGDGLVVVETSDGAVHAIQAANAANTPPLSGSPLPGSLLWSRSVGRPGGRLEPAGIGPDLVVVCQDEAVHALDRRTGSSRWTETTKGMNDTGAASIGPWVYAPNGNRVDRFPALPTRNNAAAAPARPGAAGQTDGSNPQAANAPARKTGRQKKRPIESLLPPDLSPGGTITYPPQPLREGLLWCTAEGLLVALLPAEVEWRRLEFALENPPAGPPAVRGGSIFAATTTGDLARIDVPAKMTKRAQLQLVWHTVLPAPAESSPFVTGDTVVVSLGDAGLAAYSAETGAMLWQTCFPGTILSIGGGRVWVIDRVGRLSALGLADGERRETMCLGPFTLPLSNLRDERMFLASPTGMIVSLRPRSVATDTTPDAEAAAKTQPEAEPEAEKSEPMPDADADEAMTAPEVEPGQDTL